MYNRAKPGAAWPPKGIYAIKCVYVIMITVAWSWIDGENESVENEQLAKSKILARFPEAIFQDWAPCEEPEANENEEVMWVNVGGEPKLALYQND